LDVTAEELVNMSAKDLATQEKKEKMEAMAQVIHFFKIISVVELC